MLNIIVDNPNKEFIDKARIESRKLTAHITGVGSDKELSMITGLENETQLTLRKNYHRSNKDIFGRIHRPEDKIFSSKGGSTLYDMSPKLQKDFILKLKDVYNGFSVRGWVESFAKPYFHTDPMGLVLIEVGYETAYPTYKSINSIHDYALKGRDVEYLV